MSERYVHIGRIAEVIENIKLELSTGSWARIADYVPPQNDGLRRVFNRKGRPLSEIRMHTKMIPIPRNMGRYLQD